MTREVCLKSLCVQKTTPERGLDLTSRVQYVVSDILTVLY